MQKTGMGWVEEPSDRGVLNRAIHPFDLTVGPRMVEFGEAMVDAVLVVDVEGAVTLTNTAAARLTGYSVEELRGMPIAQLLSDERSGLRTVVRRRIEDGAVLRREESWLVPKDGAPIPVEGT